MKNTADLIALINTNWLDNITKLISPAKSREIGSQLADSALNKMDTTLQSVAGPVAFGSTVTKGGKGVLVAASERVILLGASTAAIQQPTTLGTAIQVEFGAAQTTTELSLAANGTITCNVSGSYAIRFKLQFGRSGASGVSYLMTRIMKNGVHYGVVQSTRLSSSDSIIPTDLRVVIDLLAGDTVKLEFVRDPLGANTGGLYQQIATTPGWSAAPSAFLFVSVVEGVA